MTTRFLWFRLRQPALLRLVLLSITLFDEIVSGFPVIGLPLLRDELGLSYVQVGLLFTVGEIVAMLLDPMTSLLSDRSSKRWWVIGGVAGMALGFALAGSVHTFGLLLLAFSLISVADNAAIGLSQAALIDLASQDTMRTMTRWTVAGGVGDLLSPLTVSALVAMHLGWSALCWVGASLWLFPMLVLLFQRFPHPNDSLASETSTAPSVSLWAGFREALRDPLLLRWAVLSLIPTMVDEIFLGFAALYLHDVLGASEAMIGIIVAIQMLGGILSLLALGWFQKRIAPERLLQWLAVLGLVGIVGLLSTRVLWLAALALFVTSLGTAGWYPIAAAEAYNRLPGRSGTVQAVKSLGAPLEGALPGIVGLVAQSFGVLAGVGVLGLAPVLMLLLIPRDTKTKFKPHPSA